MTDQTKPAEQPQDAKRRFAEYVEKLSRDPRFKLVPPSGQGFIIPTPGGIPPKPDRP
jgi:hypothetical protein